MLFRSGYDHNFVVAGEPGKLRKAAIIHEPDSDRKLEIFTTQPGIQFYSGNFLDGSVIGKGGVPYQKRTGL